MTSPAPVNPSLASLPLNFDVIVVGAGGAGLAAALFADIAGLQVLLLESTDHVGGTTALSAGTVWIPNSKHAGIAGQQDSVERAAAYLDSVVGDFSDAGLRRAFLEAGPRALALLESQTHFGMRAYALHPDYESDREGSTLQGRALEPLPFDGRRLGEAFGLLRPPIEEFTVLGGMMVDRTDINHLLGMTRSFTSLRHALRILGRHALDRLRHPRGTRLVLGNAMVASMLLSARERNIPICTGARLESLVRRDGRIVGVEVMQAGKRIEIAARHGVVLTSGGFNRHPGLRARLLPDVPSFTPGAPGHTGQAQSLALKAGAQLGRGNAQNAFWAPVSVRRRADGSQAVFPHFVFDRAKPGTLAVNQAGLRFVNESTSYHRFVVAMLESQHGGPSVPAYLIADRRALEAYGLGMVRPGGRGLRPFVKDGYLVFGSDLHHLAQKLGIDAAALERTVSGFGAQAASGIDRDFGRGSTAYQRNLGDPAVGPNPTMRALGDGPFYAVRLYPGDIGASTGLVTDSAARVLDHDSQSIPGLYAAGNDMNSVMGGVYPGPGITIGPALTFAFLALQHIAGEHAGEAARAGPDA